MGSSGYRQGDVLMIPVAKKLTNTTQHTELTLQLGEATGHHHTLYPPTSGVLGVIEEEIDGGERFVALSTEWLLRHQEHEDIRIPPGVYRIVIEEHRDPYSQQQRRVID